TVEAQSSRVPTLLPDDPYVAVRQAYLVDTDTESKPNEAPSELEEFQPLVSREPLTDKEFEVSKPSDTRITPSHSSASSDSTTPLSPDHPLTHVSPTPTPTRVSFHHRTAHMDVRTQPTLSPGMLARIAEAAALSHLPSVRENEDKSSNSDAEREGHVLDDEGHCLDEEGHGLDDEGHVLDNEGHGLDDEGHGLEDEGPCSKEEEEETAPEGQQQAVLVVDTVASEPLGLGYGALRHCKFALGEGSVPSTFEVAQSSVTIPHNLFNLVITKLDSTEKLVNEIGKLRAISSHVLGASGVQIPQNNLDNLKSTEEEEVRATEVLDPRDVPGSVLLEIIDFAILGLLLEPLGLGTLGLLV
ncbi:hypothetical protein Tco_1412845, partial [Tanacetum coccineum]